MSQFSQRYFGVPPKFDPNQGKTVLQPEGKGYGYWVGGHNVIYDPQEGKFYLYYRLRTHHVHIPPLRELRDMTR